MPGEGFELTFEASLHSVATGDEKRIATFYVMNTSRNLRKWGVTDAALEQALPTLLKKPIGLGEGYRKGHFKDAVDVGSFIEVEKPNGYALARVAIEDDVAWENLSKGEWGPISVVIKSFDEECSLCGENLKGMSNPWEHEHLQNGSGYLQVTNFVFDRVDFVEIPAYPQANMITFGADQTATEPFVVVPLTLCAEAYSGQASQSTGKGPQGAPGQNPEEKKEKKVTDEDIETLKAELQSLKEKLANYDDLVAKADKAEGLETELNAIKAKRKAELLEKVVEARFKAGLCSKKDEESERLKDKSESYLTDMLLDTTAILVKMASFEPQVKRKYTDEDTDPLSAAIEGYRRDHFGYTRDADGQRVM